MTQEQRIEYFMSEISRLSNQVVDLQNERDALAAQVEVMRIALDATRQPHMDYIPKLNTTAAKVLEATPQQHLAELKADAGLAGFVKGCAWFVTLDYIKRKLTVREAANQYADSIRQEVK